MVAINYLPILSLVTDVDKDRLSDLMELLLENVQSQPDILNQLGLFIEKRDPEYKPSDASMLSALLSVLSQ